MHQEEEKKKNQNTQQISTFKQANFIVVTTMLKKLQH